MMVMLQHVANLRANRAKMNLQDVAHLVTAGLAQYCTLFRDKSVFEFAHATLLDMSKKSNFDASKNLMLDFSKAKDVQIRKKERWVAALFSAKRVRSKPSCTHGPGSNWECLTQ